VHDLEQVQLSDGYLAHGSLVTKATFEDGHNNVYGSDKLKPSQGYPDGFGTEMQKLYEKHKTECEAGQGNKTI